MPAPPRAVALCCMCAAACASVPELAFSVAQAGFSEDAYLDLLDVWRTASPAHADARQAAATFVMGRAAPDWTRFMVSAFGRGVLQKRSLDASKVPS